MWKYSENEILSHLSKEGKEYLCNGGSFKDKQTIRGCDYRDEPVVLPQILQGRENFDHDLCFPMQGSKLQEILYTEQAYKLS